MESIHVRCPQCAKLYSVDRAEIRTEKPQFECIDCRSRFWFSFPPPIDAKEVRAFRIGESAAAGQPDVPTRITQIPTLQPSPPASEDVDPTRSWRSIEEKVSTFICFKCGFANQKGSRECSACGVVFEKLKKAKGAIKESVVASLELKRLWDEVLENYSHESKHEIFLKMALAQKNLPYASQQYRMILEANPADEIAARMRDKIINIATFTYVPPKRETVNKKPIPFPAIFTGLGFFIVLLGLTFPPLRDLVPIGAVFCTVGLLTMGLKRLQD